MSRKNCAIADAFMKTREGKAIVIEAKKSIHPRFKELDQLAYRTYVSAAPSNHYHLYRAAIGRIRDLAASGGQDFEQALHCLKMAWVDRKSFEKAGQCLVPDEKVRYRLGYRW